MGTITTGIGLVSGIDTTKLIDSLIALEGRGKVALQNRVIKLQSQQSAMLDINARLLSLKSIASSFRANSIFQSARAVSSNKDILSATASSKAQPGSYQFTVRQLVSHSQKISKGFADSTVAPVGLDFLSISFGKGNLDRDRPLAELNGGAGVAGGKITITDKSGNTAAVDLTDAVTLGEVMDRINGSSGVSVKARFSGDGLLVEDNSGGGGTLTIADAIGFTTAADLGILGSTSGMGIAGTSINVIGATTPLSALNDGLGVLIRNNVPDLQITDRSGAIHLIDLGQVNQPLTADTLLSDLNAGAGINISADHDNPDLRLVARDGTIYDVNLTGVTTLGELISRVNSETFNESANQPHIQLAIHADGKRLTVTDTIGGGEPLKVLGAGTNGTATASGLGILNETGVAADNFSGAIIPNKINVPAATTIGQVIERINAQTNGAVIASIGSDGVSVTLTDATGQSASSLIAESTAGNPHAAAQLGLWTGQEGVATSEMSGQRLVAHLGSVLVRNVNGGGGLQGDTALAITDRAGNSMTVEMSALRSFHSLSQIIDHINTEAAAQGVAVSATLGSGRTGLLINDTSGSTLGNLIVTGDGAAALGIETGAEGVAANSMRGSNLDHAFVGVATKLSDLNFGKGIGHGSFRITDGFGKTATININANQTTLYDVIQVINAQAGGSTGLAIKARINDSGTGLLIEAGMSDVEPGATPFVPIKVEAVSGTTAKDLRLLGQSEHVHIDDGPVQIDGSYRTTIAFNQSDSLSTVAQKINAAGVPVSASILNTGAASNPFRLNLTSNVGGTLGELIVDSGGADLGLTTLVKGQDAKVFFGSPDAAGGGFLITSRTNTIKDVVEGVTLDLHAASDEPVTINVNRDTEKIVSTVTQFVDAFNEAIGKIGSYDYFDLEKEERGVLLGNPTTARVRGALHRALNQRVEGVSGPYQFLRDVGIRLGAGGKAQFDEARFNEAYNNDPAAVEALFAALESTSQTTQQIAPGITAQSSSSVSTARGVGAIFEDLLKGLTDPFDGTLTRADASFKSQIELVRDRIEVFDQRLEAKRERLERQFLAMETALARFQDQNNALSGLVSNVLLANQQLTKR